MRVSVWTVDIDVGGTLTDGIFTHADRVVCVKVDSTPHDLTVCLFDCLSQAASILEFPSVIEFLEDVELIRWSTTITSNVLAERHGPRIGLLVSKGHEKDIYGDSTGAVLNRLVAAGDVIGIGHAAGETEVMHAARSLLENGVRRICVSLERSNGYRERESAIKKIIDRQYPDHFLGSVPVLAGSDISQAADDRTRAFCAVINAYTHGALAATLFKAEDELRDTCRYAGAFLVSHINGGVAGIGKTKAIDTIESGPILGLHGSAHLAKATGLKDVVALDVGGTTAKVGILRNAEPIYRRPSDFFGIPVDVSLPYLRSIALGGGSVVKPVTSAGAYRVELGPESMGAYPGPAAYGLGGDQPTLTDAFVTAGLINPEFFLGGSKPIHPALAHNAIEGMVVRPLKVSTEEACRIIIDRAFSMVAGLIRETAADVGQDFSRGTLFAYGGNGGLFACGVAEKCGIENVQFFSLGPVFSAFGSSVSDISHVYERALSAPRLSEEELQELRAVIAHMKRESTQDLLGEGIRPQDVSYSLELELSAGGGRPVAIGCPESALNNVPELRRALASALASCAGKAEPALHMVRLCVRKPMSKPRFTARPTKPPDAVPARTGSRKLLWGSRCGEAQVYRWESLEPGNCVAGPAVLESASSTYFLPEGWKIMMDGYGNGGVQRASKVVQATQPG